MKRYQILILFIASSFAVSAQQSGSDSLDVLYPNDIYYQQVFNTYRRIGSNLRYVPIKNYTVSSLFYTGATGSLRPGQSGRITNDIGLTLSGFYTEKKVIYFGDLKIYKSYIRDLSWNQVGVAPEQGIMRDPHYFAVATPANWSNQHYEINAGMAFPLLTDKLDLTLEADYRLSNRFRANLDPLTEVKDDALKLKAMISYRKDNHIFHLGGDYSYEHTRNGAKFGNTSKNRPSFYESYSRWIAGYGTLINSGDVSANAGGTAHTLTAGYTGMLNTRDCILADISVTNGRMITKNNNVLITPDSPTDNVFGKYYTTTTTGNIFYSKKINEQRSWLANIRTKIFNGYNYLASKGGKTYRASLTDVTADLSTVKRNGQMVRYEAGASMRYASASQEDALALTAVDLSSLTTSVFILKDFALGTRAIFTPYLKAGYKHNLSAKLINGNAAYLANVTETDYTGLAARNFYNNVVNHDYNLFSQHAVTGSASAALRFLHTGKFRTTLKFTEDAEATITSGNTRWTSQFALILDY